MDPYGYDSYEEYYDIIDYYKDLRAKTSGEKFLFDQYKIVVKDINRKENWSVLKYTGKTGSIPYGLTEGKTYYWPYSHLYPNHNGIIDDEEYTTYAYPTYPEDWVILEDPFGMAYRRLYTQNRRQYSRPKGSHYLYLRQKIEYELKYMPE